jgi:hypothetical protein
MMTLAAGGFIRRFLQHVLPSGAHKVRYYGLWAPADRQLPHRAQMALGGAAAIGAHHKRWSIRNADQESTAW